MSSLILVVCLFTVLSLIAGSSLRLNIGIIRVLGNEQQAAIRASLLLFFMAGEMNFQIFSEIKISSC